jgi:hypothetical protein
MSQVDGTYYWIPARQSSVPFSLLGTTALSVLFAWELLDGRINPLIGAVLAGNFISFVLRRTQPDRHPAFYHKPTLVLIAAVGVLILIADDRILMKLLGLLLALFFGFLAIIPTRRLILSPKAISLTGLARNTMPYSNIASVDLLDPPMSGASIRLYLQDRASWDRRMTNQVDLQVRDEDVTRFLSDLTVRVDAARLNSQSTPN